MRYKLRKQKVFSLICLFHGLLVYENGCRLSAMQTDFLYFCKFVIRLMLFFCRKWHSNGMTGSNFHKNSNTLQTDKILDQKGMNMIWIYYKAKWYFCDLGLTRKSR